MRDQEFHARDKKVQKMTRDGLTEKNLTQGTEQRVSQRLADVSFERSRPEEQAAGHRAQSRTQRKQQQEKQGPKPQDFQPAEAGEADRFAEATAPEVWGPVNAPATMRDAGDKPILQNRPPGDQPVQAGQGKKRRPPAKAARPAKEPDTPDSADSPVPGLDKPGRFPFDTEDSPQPTKGGKAIQRGTRYQARFKPSEQEATAEPADSPTPALDKPGRLQFHTEDSPQPAKSGKAVGRGTRYQARFKPSEQEAPVEPDAPVPEIPAGGRLRFTREDEAAEPPPENRAAVKKRQAAKFAADAAKPEDAPRLRFERGELPPEERAAADTQAEAQHTTGQASDKSRQQKKYEKAQRRVQAADRKLEKAQAKLPTRRRVHLEKQYDSEAGKVKRRLRFEEELIPEGEKPPLPKRAVKTVVRGAKTAAVMKVHQKIRQVEHENVGVEAGHKVEFAAERATGRFLRWNKRRRQSKPYRMERKARLNVSRANADMAYRQLIKDNPQLQKKALAKWIQKQKIKRKYAAAAREAAKGAKHTQNVLTATGQIRNAVFGIYDSDGDKIDELETGRDGTAELDLDAGSYYLRELEAPEGYRKDGKKTTFKITADKTTEITVKNEKEPEDEKTGTLRLVKSAAGTGARLSGASFAVYPATGDKKVADLITGVDGVAELSLEPGSYYLKEQRAPEGFKLEPARILFTITADAKTTVEVTNEKEGAPTPTPSTPENPGTPDNTPQVTIPKTGEAFPALQYALAALLLAVSTLCGAALYRERRQIQ